MIMSVSSHSGGSTNTVKTASNDTDTIGFHSDSISQEFDLEIQETFERLKDEGMNDEDLFHLSAVLFFRLDIHKLNDRLNEAMGYNAADTTPKNTYNDLVAAQKSMHNPPPGGYTDDRTIELFDRFMEVLTEVRANKETDQTDASSQTASSQTESSPTEPDTQVASFFDKVRAAGGALNYIQQQNMEKIEKLVEEKRKELEASMGINAQPPLSPEALATAKASIEELLENYKKNLIENMEKRSGSIRFDEDSFLKQLIHDIPDPKVDETSSVN